MAAPAVCVPPLDDTTNVRLIVAFPSVVIPPLDAVEKVRLTVAVPPVCAPPFDAVMIVLPMIDAPDVWMPPDDAVTIVFETPALPPVWMPPLAVCENVDVPDDSCASSRLILVGRHFRPIHRDGCRPCSGRWDGDAADHKALVLSQNQWMLAV